MTRTLHRDGYSLMILRCPDGHEWPVYFKMWVPLTHFVLALREADTCLECGKGGCVVLTDQAYREALSRLMDRQCQSTNQPTKEEEQT